MVVVGDCDGHLGDLRVATGHHVVGHTDGRGCRRIRCSYPLQA